MHLPTREEERKSARPMKKALRFDLNVWEICKGCAGTYGARRFPPLSLEQPETH